MKKTPEEVNRIFSGKKCSSIIGSDDFIARLKKRFFDKKRHIEIPESKLLSPEIKNIKSKVSKAYKLKEGELDHSRRGSQNEARDMAIYLSRQFSGSKLADIGKEFGIDNYSTVSTIIERMKGKISKDERVRKRMQDLMDDMKMGQEQTPFYFLLQTKNRKVNDMG